MFELTDDPISPSMHALLNLFANELKAVKFPDMDRSVLEKAAEAVKERAEAVARAQAALDAARTELLASQESLLQKGQRALAYARVFVEERPELAQQLDSIQLSRPVSKLAENAAPKRRGRPPEMPRSSDSLFSEPGSADGTPSPDVEAAA